ncbi:ATP-binding response regulator [Paenibacillus apiarius]|uniref:histidine kinase n=1 Tax=Paenibacillus apiarius TaxID=46240 RepID=A0ABT4DXQ7_9BACL|nr:ATP-binding protein [Paenibacillus apiarius]MCY9517616.1 ATP-binding protein [Paenibacillus apiarius]MCY9522124.1 ATP-binding protein [Paenibacillus apiarius]MCY9552587.1 ATP-binding protein [Paenibacillus apiarius]MCY9559236.1 ATP-binding protein [Paenibacillus apiarius]MCY9683659.1 ATP-binding protein [Paenibacillus apiarius]
MIKIVVVDDESSIRAAVAYALHREGYEVETAADGQETLDKVETFLPAVMVLDVMMPRVSGYDVCRKLDGQPRPAILLLTVKDDIVDKVLGLELGADDYMTKPFDMRELLLEEAVARLQGKADSCRVTIHTSLVAGEVWADPENVMHIMLNLLDNAVKYNRPGGQVHMRNYTVASADEAHRMIIEVADTGIGIPEEAISRIFDPFYTVSKDRSRTSGGTGLGLALVRNLAENQGGTVQFAETGPDGSCFRVELPLHACVWKG